LSPHKQFLPRERIFKFDEFEFKDVKVWSDLMETDRESLKLYLWYETKVIDSWFYSLVIYYLIQCNCQISF
jgi:hypothetical protein